MVTRPPRRSASAVGIARDQRRIVSSWRSWSSVGASSASVDVEGRPVDGLPCSIDHLDPLEQPFEGLALPQVGAYQRHLLVALELLAHLVGLLADPLGDRLRYSASRSSSVDLDAPRPSATARRARSTLTASVGGLAQLVDERLLVLPGGCEVLVERRCPGPGGAWRGPARRCLHLGVDQRPRATSSSTSSARASAGLLLQRHLGLHLLDAGRGACARSARSSSRVSNSEASAAHVVVGVGQHLLPDLLHEDPEVDRVLVGVGVVGGELEDVADLGARRAARRARARRCRCRPRRGSPRR